MRFQTKILVTVTWKFLYYVFLNKSPGGQTSSAGTGMTHSTFYEPKCTEKGKKKLASYLLAATKQRQKIKAKLYIATQNI